MIWLSTAVLFLCAALTAGENAWWKNTLNLQKELFQTRNYSSKANPQPTQNHTTNVYVHINVRSLTIDDKSQVLTLNAITAMTWIDHRLTWDAKDFGNLYQTTVGWYYVWRPDLFVYNSAEPTNTHHYGYTPIIVYHNGQVVWVPPMTTKTECAMDLTYWPFDTQNCVIVMGSWTSNGFQIDFHPLRPNASTEDMMMENIKTSHHWTTNKLTLKRISTKYDCCEEPYITLNVDITMTRTSPSFASTIILPAIAVALLALVQFVLPVDYPPRVTVGVASALLSTLMLILLYTTLPPLGDSCPLIVKYYGLTLVMTVLSIALSGVLARLAKEQLEVISFPPPAILKSILTGPLATVLCVRTMADKVSRGGGGNMANEDEILGESKGFQHEWLLLATAVDRLAAFTYVIIIVIALLVTTAPLH